MTSTPTALGLLNELSDEHIDWIFRTGIERPVAANTVIIREGEPLAAIYMVLEGLLAVKVSAIHDSEICRLGPGEIIGEISFLENIPPSASVITIESSLLLEIPSPALEERLRSASSFSTQFYRALAILNARRVRERVDSVSKSFYAKLDAITWNKPGARAFFSAIERFKSVLLQADLEALKNDGRISETTSVTAQGTFVDFCRVVNSAIGDSSEESEAVKNELGARLQREILPFMLLTKTTERFYSKPRGYAGDFLTIERIYQNRAAGAGRIGPLLDRCFLNTPAAKAIRNRRALMAKEIMKRVDTTPGVTHVGSLACGSANEVFDVFRQLDDHRRLQTSLVDIDLHALAHVAERRDKAKLQNRMNLINANLVYLAMGRQKLDLKGQDLIYSIGLIDYLHDKFVVKLLNWIHARLHPGGAVILANFHPNNYCKAMMDYVLEWKLIHRTEGDMHRLFSESAFECPCTRVLVESEGVNLFAECVKQ